MRTLHLAGILVWGIGLSGCGPSLGNYEVMEIAVVEKLPETLRLDRGPEPFLKLSIRSNFDLVADAMNVYAFKTSCSWPYAEDRMIHGPLAAAAPPIDLYDAEPAMKRDAQGKASYVLYLPVAAPAQKPIPNLDDVDPAYDLSVGESDLCLKIIQTGYFITESRSEIIRVSRSDLSQALARMAI